MYLSICLSIYLSIYLSVYLSIYLSVYLSIHPSFHLSIHPSIYPVKNTIVLISTISIVYMATMHSTICALDQGLEPKTIARGKQCSGSCTRQGQLDKRTNVRQRGHNPSQSCRWNFTWQRSKDPGNDNPGELQYHNTQTHTQQQQKETSLDPTRGSLWQLRQKWQ